jgi:hypothetical protein
MTGIVRQVIGEFSVTRKLKNRKEDLYDVCKLFSSIEDLEFAGKSKFWKSKKGQDIARFFPMKIKGDSVWVTWNILVSMIFRLGSGKKIFKLRNFLCPEPELYQRTTNDGVHGLDLSEFAISKSSDKEKKLIKHIKRSTSDYPIHKTPPSTPRNLTTLNNTSTERLPNPQQQKSPVLGIRQIFSPNTPHSSSNFPKYRRHNHNTSSPVSPLITPILKPLTDSDIENQKTINIPLPPRDPIMRAKIQVRTRDFSKRVDHVPVPTKGIQEANREEKLRTKTIRENAVRREDTNKLLKLTSRENKLKNIFDRIDHEKIGTIKIEQMQPLTLKWGVDLSDPNLKLFLSTSYGNRRLTFEQYCAFLKFIYQIRWCFDKVSENSHVLSK